MRKRLLSLLLCLMCLPAGWAYAAGSERPEALPWQDMEWPRTDPSLTPVPAAFGYRIIGRGDAGLYPEPVKENLIRYMRAGVAVPLAQEPDGGDFVLLQMPEGETAWALSRELREPEPQEVPAYALDTSTASLGYVYAAARGTEPLMLVVQNGSLRHTVRIPPDEVWHPFLLALGEGEYDILIYQAGHLDKYLREILSQPLGRVTPPDTHTLALMDSAHCDMANHPALVAWAQALCEDADSDLEKVTRIRKVLYANARYDTEYARTIQYTKIPEPEIFLTRGNRGICSDYAAFFTIACRAVGVPCKSVSGINYRTGNSHAWNEVWIEDDWYVVDVVNEKSAKQTEFVAQRASDSAYVYVDTFWGGFD